MEAKETRVTKRRRDLSGRDAFGHTTQLVPSTSSCRGLLATHRPGHRIPCGAHMTIPKGWQGSCAPLVYIGQCQTKDIGRYQTYARFWLAANSLVCLFLLAAFIRRCIVVKERFNTIRLLMLKFIAGLVLYAQFQVSVPPHFHPPRNSWLCPPEPDSSYTFHLPRTPH